MYSTLCYENHPTPYVLTNDLMRDHRLSVFASIPFVRWRSSQIVYYSIARDYTEQMKSEMYFQTNNSKEETHAATVENDMAIGGEVYFLPPG
jgi:hypothetical protein